MEAANLYNDKTQWPVISAETFPTENFRPIDPIVQTITELRPYIDVVTTTWGALGSPRGGTPALSRILHTTHNF